MIMSVFYLTLSTYVICIVLSVMCLSEKQTLITLEFLFVCLLINTLILMENFLLVDFNQTLR